MILSLCPVWLQIQRHLSPLILPFLYEEVATLRPMVGGYLHPCVTHLVTALASGHSLSRLYARLPKKFDLFCVLPWLSV